MSEPCSRHNRVRSILLGVTGGIAAYKAVELLRLLRKDGADVTVVMTANAKRFVGAATFQALSGRPVADDSGPAPGMPIEHLALAQGADLVIVAPATANTLAKMAAGIADDLLGTLLLATTAPVLVAPAMNTRMLLHPATRANLATLAARGVHVVPAESGALAAEEAGSGRLAAVATIHARVREMLWRAGTSPAGASWSPRGRRAKRSTRCATSRTAPPGGWAWRWPPPRSAAAPR